MASINNPIAISLLTDISKDKGVSELFFSDPPSCLVIFRLLPEISKNLIIRAINSNENGLLEISELKNHDFFINTKSKNINEYIAGLTQLKILQETGNKYIINNYFFETMKKILSEGLIQDKKKFHRKARGYEKYLEKGMNRFYKFINEKIFDQSKKEVQENEINNFLVKACFLQEGSDKKYSLASLKTFLNKTEELIIFFFYRYLNYIMDSLKEKKFTFFHLLFYLATLEPGSYFTEFPKAYYDSSFDKHLEFMNQTGFLIIKTETINNKTIKKYYCTPLIQSLFENNNISEDFALLKYGDENAHRFLYVETNMKFYAFMPTAKMPKKDQTSLQLNMSENFTSSSYLEKESKDEKNIFYVNLLRNMFRIEMILPDNGLIGYITRENLKNIFKHLPDSGRLLQFLSDHMSLNYDDVTTIGDKKYLINESVVNQILVLENEKKSVEVIQPVVCLYDFSSKNQYRYILDLIKSENIRIIKEQETKDNMIIVIQSKDVSKIQKKINI